MSRISGSSRASKLMGRAGDGSTLTLDFAAMGGTLDSRITFSRADATALATFINSSGFVQTVATAQAPRFDFDPTTLVAKGLLLEGPATNLLNWSETFATTGGTNNNWADTNLTRTSTNNTSPRNDATALRITASAANGTIISSAAIGTSASRVLSVWLRRVTGTGNIQYTLDNGTSYTTQAITSSWVRYSFPATTAAQRVGFRIVTSADAIEIWGAQLETTASSSYIATGSGQVNRAVDTAIIAGTNFSSWYTGGTSGTFVSNWYGSPLTATARSVIATSDQTTKHLHMYQTASALTLRLADFPVTTVTTANNIAQALTKGAFSYNGTATSLCLNAGTVATGTLAFSVAPTWLSLGGPSTNGTSITDTTVMLNNSIRTLKYFPARLSDGQIQGLTDLNVTTYTAEVLVVAGGGSGGGNANGGAGGGGAGGVTYTASVTLAPSTSYTVVVGDGGAYNDASALGASGGNSTFDTTTTTGGGGGRAYQFNATLNGGNGGSGGGGGGTFLSPAQSLGGTGTVGQGNNGGGGNIGSSTTTPDTRRGGGGGGASAVGNAASGGDATANGGSGGAGSAYSISGASVTYGGGGGGGGVGSGGSAAGGSGGGGRGANESNSVPAVAGTANTGGGGGGAGSLLQGSSAIGASGGSGVVIISYAGAQRGIGGTVTSFGGNTIHTFFGPGIFTYTG